MHRAAPAFSTSNPRLNGFALAIVAAVAFFIAGRLCAWLPRSEGRLAPIWAANAVALAFLLRTQQRRWPALIAASMASNLLVSMVAGSSLIASLCMTMSNALEYTLAAASLRRLLGEDVRIGRGRDLCLFAAIGFGAALCSAAVASVSLDLLQGDPLANTLRIWMLAHPLSLVLISPCLLALSRPREHLLDEGLTLKAVFSLIAMTGSVLLVFGQSRFPILFLIPPMLLMVSLQLGTLGAAIGILITGVFAVVATVTNHGPLTLIHGDTVERSAILQLFLVVSLFSSLPVASLQARQRRLQVSTLAEAKRAAAAEAAAAASEARYRLLADRASDALVTLDLGGTFTYLSPAITSLTGYADTEMLGRTPADFIEPDDYPGVQRAFRALANGTRASGTPIEYRFRRKDGRIVWLQVNPQVIFGASGKAESFVDVARDVTAQKELESQLRAARAQAERAMAAKSEFLDNMSHELRTPLTSIIGFAGLLRHSEGLGPQHQMFAEKIVRSGNVLLTTINDVLDFSKLDADAVQLETRSIDFGRIVGDAVEIIQGQAEQKGLSLCVEIADDLPRALIGDETRLRQVMLNLLGNAVKFTAQGGVRVQVETQADGDRAFVTCRVSDTGLGIEAEVIPRLFSRFVQADGSTTRNFGGTGLGLAICDRLIGLMGGDIGVQSQPGEGSCFHFTVALPIAQARTVAA